MDALDRPDTEAELRDRTARARDAAATARDRAMDDVEAGSPQEEHSRKLTGSDILIRAASQRKRAHQRRTQAAQQRELAAQDRQHAAEDREQAALERGVALAERDALIAELRHQQARADQALRDQRRAELLARTLQRSLSPPILPHIDGLDVAVHYEPCAPEEVGGDFYDLFALADGRSGFFLGDVCGKGSEAAAVTSLARYTMRTAAMLHEAPAAIVMDLNAALLMQSTDPIQTCTTVYGEIDMSSAAAEITLAVAGHPPPIIVRADGSVEATAARGTMLGVIGDPTFETCEVNLEPGDAIVLCSDGIQDTVMNGARSDEQRVAGLLAGTPHAGAQALVERLTQALQSSDRPLRDDVAIMVLHRTRSDRPQPGRR